MMHIKYLKATGEIIGYGTDCWDDSHPTEATMPMVEGFDFAVHTHVKNGKLHSEPQARKAKKLLWLKAERNFRLDEADRVHCNAERWFDMDDDERKAWKAYKQALRDFPAVCDPDNPQWPVPPKK